MRSLRLMPVLLLLCGSVAMLQVAHGLGLRVHRGGRAEQQEVLKIEDNLRQALLVGDATVLEKVLAEDFLGISANGTLSDKQQYVRRIGKKEHQFSRIDVMERKVRVQGTSAIVVTTANVVGKLDAQAISGEFRYTRVYSRGADGAWRLRNFEATRVSGAGETEMRRGTPVLKTK